MPDTRVAYKAGIPGFKPGQVPLWNQIHQVTFEAGWNWKMHATVQVLDKTGAGLNETRKISQFHVSLYCTDDNLRWGGFYWEFNSKSDSFVFKGWINWKNNKDKDILGVSDKDYDSILIKAKKVVGSLKSTFGSTGIEAPRWGDEKQTKLVAKVPTALAPKPLTIASTSTPKTTTSASTPPTPLNTLTSVSTVVK